jgi:uncharacterized protein YbbC (DUF1343 family)
VAGPVLTGLDVLVREGFARLAGRKVGLVTNHSGIDRRGRHGIDLMVESPKVDLVALFSPEHGIRGLADARVASGVDAKSGLVVHSLYGKTKKPTGDMLAGLDTLVFDIQDIGARFYTYNATLGGCLEVAKEHGLRLVVLDRPNPLGGDRFEGPVQDDDLVGAFTAYYPMPITHGMTLGELAGLYNEDAGADLVVVPLENWRRAMRFDETGLPWVNPSPNMRSVNEELLYPMVALTESNKDLSVGRGTDRPFEYLGAPWVDGAALTAELRRRALPGLWFMETTFVPAAVDVSGRKNAAYPFVGQVCRGVRVVVTDRNALRPVEAGLHMLAALKAVHPGRTDLSRLRGLVGAAWVLDALEAGEDPSAVARRCRASAAFKAFAAKRARALRYD